MHSWNLPDFADGSNGFGPSNFYGLLTSVYTLYNNIFYSSGSLQSNNHSVVLLESIFLGVAALNLVGATCEIGERLTSSCNGVEVQIYKLDWYLYPLEIKRLLIPMMVYAQKPVEINFFGTLSCSRQQFKQVRLGYAFNPF